MKLHVTSGQMLQAAVMSFEQCVTFLTAAAT